MQFEAISPRSVRNVAIKNQHCRDSQIPALFGGHRRHVQAVEWAGVVLQRELELTYAKSERDQMHSPGICHLPAVVWESFAESRWELLEGWFFSYLLCCSLSLQTSCFVLLKYRILLRMKIQSEGIRCCRKAEERPQGVLVCGRGLELGDL